MKWRSTVWFAIKHPRPATYNRFTAGRVFPIYNSRFMLNRLRPLMGWRDRMSGFYTMNHNKHLQAPLP